MIASLKGYGRIARTVLAVIAGLLVLGIVGSLVMGARATASAKEQVVEQASAIANGSLTLAFTPNDVTGPVSPDRAAALTNQLQAIVVDPSDFDTVTLYDPEGTILYSTEQSRIGNKLPGEKDRIAQALKGTPQSEDVDGAFSVMLPLKFRSGVGGPAVVELIRPDTPIASAAGPWRTNALFLFAMLILLGVAVFGVARVLAVVTDTEQKPVRPQPQAPPQQPVVRPIRVPQPGLREESEARRRAEERAQAAEDRLDLLQEQYRKTLEELQGFQRIAREPQRTVDPRLEERALRAEGVVSTLQQQIQTLTAERERLAAELMDATTVAGGRNAERRVSEAERESAELRHELEESRSRLTEALAQVTELRGRLDDVATGTGAPPDVQRELDQAHVELLRSRDSLSATTSQLHAAQRELDDARLELRALRNEEQRATMLEEELRTTKAELESIKASHRADLVEREAEFEEKVRATREEFQRQLGEIDASYKGQLDQRESALAGRITLAEETAREAERELEAARSEAEAARAEAASREQRLLQATDELAQRKQEIQSLQQEIKERTIAIGHARKEADDLKRSLVAAQADLARTDETVTTMRLELEASQTRANAVEVATAAADRDRGALTQRVEKLTRMLEEAAAENADLNRRLQDFEARRQLELADDAGRAEIDELLRVTQERLAGQTEKLISAEDRVRALEAEIEATNERTELLEAELRTHQMSEALREMREGPSEAAHDGAAEVLVAAADGDAPLEDRRASSPFMQELSTDAKKTLSRINGIAQLLKHQKGAKEQAQLIKQLTSYARRLDFTVSDIAEADHLARGTVELQSRRTDLEALVNRVVEESEAATDHEVRVVTEPITLRIDPQRTDQILSALLRNANDRTSANKEIVVRLQQRDGGAVFSVEDPEPSSDASMSPVVRRFAELQGGWAKVESTETGGSAFRVFLPDVEARHHVEQPAEGQPAEGQPADEQPAAELHIVVDGSTQGAAEEPWEAASAEKILSRELRRLAELPADER